MSADDREESGTTFRLFDHSQHYPSVFIVVRLRSPMHDWYPEQTPRFGGRCGSADDSHEIYHTPRSLGIAPFECAAATQLFKPDGELRDASRVRDPERPAAGAVPLTKRITYLQSLSRRAANDQCECSPYARKFGILTVRIRAGCITVLSEVFLPFCARFRSDNAAFPSVSSHLVTAVPRWVFAALSVLVIFPWLQQ